MAGILLLISWVIGFHRKGKIMFKLLKSIIGTLAFIAVLSSFANAQSRTIATSNLTINVAPPTLYPNSAPTNCLTGHFGSGGPAVTACGNDTVGCGTLAAPCASPQYAVNIAYRLYDWANQFAPTIQLASAPCGSQFYYGPVQMSGPLIGQPGILPPLVVGPGKPNFNIGNYNPFIIQGDITCPLGAFLLSGDIGFPSSSPALSLSSGAGLKIQGLSFDTGAAAQDCVDIMDRSFLDLGFIEWGNCGNGVGAANYNIGLGIAFNSAAIISNPLVVSGGGNMAALVQLGQNSSLTPNNNGQTRTNISFGGGNFASAAFIIGGNSVIYTNGFSFSGSFTGNGIQNVENSTIENGTGAGPNTCPAGLILGHANVFQDNSVCR